MQWIAVALGGYLIVTGAVFLMQRTLLYPSGRLLPELEKAGVEGLQAVTTPTRDGLTLLHWYRPPATPESPVIAVFHGNAGHMGDRVPKLGPLLDQGYGLFFASYRGYGGNPGKPTETDLTEDSRGVLVWLEDQGIGLDRIVLYGESLGTGVAVKLATERAVAALVLEAPYTSIAELSQHHYWYLPARWLILDPWDSLARIPEIRAPLLVLHGDQDPTVPLRYGRRLFAAAPEPKAMFEIEGGGHVDLYDYPRVAERVIGFIQTYVNTSRRLETTTLPPKDG